MTEPKPGYLRETAAAYDLVAEDYAELLREELAGKPLDRALLAAFAEAAAQFAGAEVADVGCGPGRIAGHLRSLGLTVTGIDLSSEMLKVARRDHPGIRFQQGSMLDLPLPEASLAGVLAWYSIIHLPPAELPRVFAQFFRVLRPGGQLLLAFQAGQEKRRITHAYGHDVALDAYRLPPDEIEQLLVTAGFGLRASVLRQAEAWEKTPQAYLLAEKPGRPAQSPVP